jgi:hypothetical protein
MFLTNTYFFRSTSLDQFSSISASGSELHTNGISQNLLEMNTTFSKPTPNKWSNTQQLSYILRTTNYESKYDLQICKLISTGVNKKIITTF